MFGPTSPSFSIGNSTRKAFQQRENSNLPGPADYNISALQTTSKISFTKQLKESKILQRAPGPGQYNIPSTIGTGPKSVFQHRGRLPQRQPNPGPADYSPLKSYSTFSFTMTSRKPAKSLTNIPGPGTYNSEYDKLPKTPRATIGRSKRLLISLGPDNPGPGDYSPSSVQKKSPNTVMSKSVREGFKFESVPGPGAYEISREDKYAPFTTLKPRRQQQSTDKIPGPADYSPKYQLPRKQQVVIGKAMRESKSKNDSPGPNSYDVKAILKDEPKWSMGKSQRKVQLGQEKQTPGPGQYGSFDKYKPDSAQYSFRGKFYKRAIETSPGPTDYQVNYTMTMKSNQRPTIGNQFRKTIDYTQNPSPADYSPTQKTPTRAFSFGRQRKHIERLVGGPGPGAYNIPHTIGTSKESLSKSFGNQ